MTSLVEPICQLPPYLNGQGSSCLLAGVLGRYKQAFFAGFGVLVNKTALFSKKTVQSPLEVSNSAILLQGSVSDPERSDAFLIRSVTFLVRLMTFLTRLMALLIRLEAFLTRSVTFLIRSKALLTRSMTFLIRSVTLLIRSMAFLIRSAVVSARLKPGIRVKMAQHDSLQADLITAKTPRMIFFGTMQFTNFRGRDSALRCPRRRAQRQATETGHLWHSLRPAGRGRRSAASLPPIKFVKDIIPVFFRKYAGAEVARLKAKEVMDSLRRPLQPLINFNVPVLKNGIQRVVYTDNNSAAWRSWRLGG